MFFTIHKLHGNTSSGNLRGSGMRDAENRLESKAQMQMPAINVNNGDAESAFI